MVRQQHIVIVGSGIVGLSTAYSLLTQGIRNVTVLEQDFVDHTRSSSHGFSRLLRYEYGSDAFYSNMVSLSLQRWRELQEVARRTIYTPTGILLLGNEHDNFTSEAYHIVRDSGLPIQKLTREDCGLRFPQFETKPYDILSYNQEGGILHASTCLQSLRDLVLDLGGEIIESCRVTQLSSDNQIHPVRLRMSSETEILADRVVLATGSWVHQLLADHQLPVRLTRQYLLYFAGLPTSLFGVGTFPAFLSEDLYGFPIHRGSNGWLKATSHKFGVSVDPNEITPPDIRFVSHIKQQLCELIPMLNNAELTHIESCMYDVTPDEDFILDRLPFDRRIIFATGLSGHGFKFGLLIGELLSSLVCDTQPPVPLDRFCLSRFSNLEIQQPSSVAS
jgi:monomeric sarcosine oxidase